MTTRRPAVAVILLCLGFLLTVGVCGRAQAVEVQRQDTSIWIRTPWKNLEAQEQRALFMMAVRLVHAKLTKLRADGKLPDSLGTIDVDSLVQAEKQIDDMARRLTTLGLLKDAVPDWIPWVPAGQRAFQPSAFFILLGTKISFGFKLLSVGGSGNLGFIITPFRVARLSEINHEVVDAFYEVSMAPLIWFHLDLGASLGGTLTSALTLGVVGGDVRSTESFRGTAVGGEAAAGLSGIGMTLHAGVLSNWYEPGALQYPYLALSLESGVIMQTPDIRLDLSQVLSDFPFYKIVSEDGGLDVLLSETLVVPIAPAIPPTEPSPETLVAPDGAAEADPIPAPSEDDEDRQPPVGPTPAIPSSEIPPSEVPPPEAPAPTVPSPTQAEPSPRPVG